MLRTALDISSFFQYYFGYKGGYISDKENKLNEDLSEKFELKPEASSCLKYSGELISEGPIQIRLVPLIYFAISGAVMYYLNYTGLPQYAVSGFSFVTIYYCILFSFVIMPLQYGLFYFLLRAVRGEELKVKHLFSFFENCWDVVFSAIIINVLAWLGGFLLFIPGIIIGCKLTFAPFLVMDKKENAINAIKESWVMTKGFALQVFLIILLFVPFIILATVIILFSKLDIVANIIIYFVSLWINLAIASLYHAVSLKFEKTTNKKSSL